MTSAQTQIVNSTVLRLTIEWVRAQDVITARCQTRGAMADLTHDCYIGRTRVAFSARDGEVCFGWLTWRLDATFAPLGPPETRLRAWPRR
jgi:hypothetical protein